VLSSPRYFDKNGQPLELFEWAALFDDFGYRQVDETKLKNGLYVSTVWLGLDHSLLMDGNPLIFETMVFGMSDEPWDEADQERYSSLTEAEAGHIIMCERWKGVVKPVEKKIKLFKRATKWCLAGWVLTMLNLFLPGFHFWLILPGLGMTILGLTYLYRGLRTKPSWDL